MGQPKKGYRKIELNLPPELIDRLKAEADRRGVKRNALAIEFFEFMLNKSN
jgi:hypothetical protein